jgi:transcriptional regulator GlxA family with amidase domain
MDNRRESFCEYLLTTDWVRFGSDGLTEERQSSICSGAIFLGYCGVFDGMYCTTHWLSLNSLKTANAEGARPTCDKPGTVIRARYVDAGLNAAGVRIISSGGVSCGLDASLHVISLRTGPGIKGEEEARRVADFIDYGWRKTEGVAFLP